MFEYVSGATAYTDGGFVAEARADHARAALAHAETKAGLRTRITSDPAIGLPAGLDRLFPAGLPSVTRISGSASLTFTLAAAVMGESGWAAFVGCDDVGWLAASESGVDLSRVITVPSLGASAADGVAACIDGFSVVVIGDIRLGGGAQRSLMGRARANGTTIITSAPWPGAAVLDAHIGLAEIGLDGLRHRDIRIRRDSATLDVRMGSVMREITSTAAGGDKHAVSQASGAFEQSELPRRRHLQVVA